MQTSDFDYILPEEYIAKSPSTQRDHSRLMVLDRAQENISHHRFDELPLLLPKGCLLVRNNAKVLNARLQGTFPTGGKWELFFLESKGKKGGIFFVSPGKKFIAGNLLTLHLHSGKLLQVQVRATNDNGTRELVFLNCEKSLLDLLEKDGQLPLPPYIEKNIKFAEQPKERQEQLQVQYQTTFAQKTGSVAAPTAGLHFTEKTFEALSRQGVDIVDITLHVGAGTFLPVKSEDLKEHTMHEESYEVSEDVWSKIQDAKANRRPVIAVGTTTTRVLEHIALGNPLIGKTSIFMYPPYHFQIVDGLITNFHLPKSTLLMLVSAFAENGGFKGEKYSDGKEYILHAYHTAIEEQYRFYSFGDAMLLL